VPGRASLRVGGADRPTVSRRQRACGLSLAGASLRQNTARRRRFMMKRLRSSLAQRPRTRVTSKRPRRWATVGSQNASGRRA